MAWAGARRRRPGRSSALRKGAPCRPPPGRWPPGRWAEAVARSLSISRKPFRSSFRLEAPSRIRLIRPEPVTDPPWPSTAWPARWSPRSPRSRPSGRRCAGKARSRRRRSGRPPPRSGLRPSVSPGCRPASPAPSPCPPGCARRRPAGPRAAEPRPGGELAAHRTLAGDRHPERGRRGLRRQDDAAVALSPCALVAVMSSDSTLPASRPLTAPSMPEAVGVPRPRAPASFATRVPSSRAPCPCSVRVASVFPARSSSRSPKVRARHLGADIRAGVGEGGRRGRCGRRRSGKLEMRAALRSAKPHGGGLQGAQLAAAEPALAVEARGVSRLGVRQRPAAVQAPEAAVGLPLGLGRIDQAFERPVGGQLAVLTVTVEPSKRRFPAVRFSAARAPLAASAISRFPPPVRRRAARRGSPRPPGSPPTASGCGATGIPRPSPRLHPPRGP